MAKVESGTERPKGTGGPSGQQYIKFDCVADQLIEAREERPTALRVVFVNKDENRINLGVPLSDKARNKLLPFVNLPDQIPHSEDGLRDLINRILPKEVWWWVEAYNGWVSSVDVKDFDSLPRVYCEPGTHRGYFHNMYQFQRADGARRVCYELLDTGSRYASFTAPWPKDLTCTVGSDPADDYIGPLSALNKEVTMWRYLCALGLDWNRFIGELEKAKALYTRLDLDAGEIPGFFRDPSDITPELSATVRRHGPQMVQWEMTITPSYGLGMQRSGTTHAVELLPVLTESDDFKRDVVKTMAAWDRLASAILGREAQLLDENGTATEDGRLIIGALWRPIVNAFPNITLTKRQDGLPGMTFPISASKWNHDGIAALGFMAERLLKLGTEELCNPTGICALRDNTKILNWCVQNVQEFATVSTQNAQEEVM